MDPPPLTGPVAAGIIIAIITTAVWVFWGPWNRVLNILLRNLPQPPSKFEVSKPFLTSRPAHDHLNLAWTVTGDATCVSKYMLLYRIVETDDSTSQTEWSTIELSGKVTKYTLKNLLPQTRYQVRVYAITEERETEETATAYLPIPSAPTGLRTLNKPTGSSIEITWDMEGGDVDSLSGYTVFFKPQEQKQWSNFDCVTKPFVIPDLKPNTQYMIKVAAHSQYGSCLPTLIDKPVLTAIPPPSPPIFVTLPDEDSPELFWEMEDLGSLQIDNFTVTYMKQNGNPSTDWVSITTKGSETSIRVPGISLGWQYYFKVVANTPGGQSLPCETVSLTMPIPPPGTPRVDTNVKPTHDIIELKWKNTNTTNDHDVIIYIIQYKEEGDEDWQEQNTLSSNTKYSLYGLQPETSYQVRIVSQCCSVQSLPSPVGGPFKTTKYRTKEQIFKDNLKHNSRQVENDEMDSKITLYQIPLITKKSTEKIEIKEFGEANLASPAKEKVLLVVGATGAGKSTLINALINYVIGTEWTDSFRFRLVEETGSFAAQHASQTSRVTVYKIHHKEEFKIPYTLTVIDTPGFGDTRGINMDKEYIFGSIRELFNNAKEYGIQHIDAVGFVAQASLPRLTATQKYIFDSILSLFGKDIADNIYVLITFSDSNKPPVMASIKEANIPFNTTYKFNNSALYVSSTNEDNDDNDFNGMFWQMGTKSFKLFLNSLGNIDEKSLKLTNEVLAERGQLEICVAGIRDDIRHGLEILEQYKIEAQVVKEHEADIAKCKDFTYQVKEHKTQHIPIQPGENTTTCLKCKRTCHYPCKFQTGGSQLFCRCQAFTLWGRCKVCEGKCAWSDHVNVAYRIVSMEVIVDRTSDELKQKYESIFQKKMTAEDLLDGILNAFVDCQLKILCRADEVKEGLKRLDVIALRPNPLSTEDYLDILIKNEESDGRPGWRIRREQLVAVKEQARTMRNVTTKEGYDPLAEYDVLKDEKLSNKVEEKMKHKKRKKVRDELKKQMKKLYSWARPSKISAPNSEQPDIIAGLGYNECYF